MDLIHWSKRPKPGKFVLTDAIDSPGPFENVDHIHHRMDRDSFCRELGDKSFRHGLFSFLILVFDEVNDFFNGLAVSSGRAGFKDRGHGGLGFEEPSHRAVKIFLGEDQGIGSVDGGDHGKFVQVDTAPGDVVEEFRMGGDRLFFQLAPVVDRGAVFVGDGELTVKVVDDPKV